jgi:hypothetical protein
LARCGFLIGRILIYSSGIELAVFQAIVSCG